VAGWWGEGWSIVLKSGWGFPILNLFLRGSDVYIESKGVVILLKWKGG